MELFKWVHQNDVHNLRHLCAQTRATKSNAMEIVDRNGNTPLLMACYMGRYEAACTLIKYGHASVRAMNYFGQNALTLATHSGNYKLVVELLRYRSYDDFNLSSMIPALMVAIMRQDAHLISYFRSLDGYLGQNLRTVHGLNASEIGGIFGNHQCQQLQKCQPQQYRL